MNLLVQGEVLTVGVEKFNQYLQKMPVRLLSFATGKQAISSLKNANINAVVCSWDLQDMPDGKFLRGLKHIKPDIHSIAIVNPENLNQEINARSVGVNAVVSQNTSGDDLIKVISNMMKIPEVSLAPTNSI